MTYETFTTVFPYWIRAFLLTLAIEIPVFAAIGRKLIGKKKISWPRLIIAAGTGTLLTHPLLWFVWPRIISDYTTSIILGELLIALIESATFYAIARPIRLPHAVITAFAANAASYAIGQLISL